MNANITPFLEKTIRNLTEYEIYGFLIQLRKSCGCPIDLIDTEPKYLKEKIFNYLESHKISDSRIKRLKKNMIEEMLPLNTVSWFYKKDRETLFILMVLKEINSNVISIRNKEDIKKTTIEMIYSPYFLISSEIPNLSMDTITLNLKKKQDIQSLKENFNRAKLSMKDLKWLDKNNRKQVEWAYKYKLKLRKKEEEEGILPKSILIHADSLSINSGDTDLMYNHIVASFDFYFYKLLTNNNNSLPQGYGIDGDRSITKTRNILINRMRNAWYKEDSRESAKKSSNIKYNISTESRKILKEMAKNQKKSEVELLEYIIEDYAKSNRFKGIL